MDTRFWGPSGWKLLHLIAASPHKHPQKVFEWFTLLPYVLPCKFCRASLQEYYEALPLTLDIVRGQGKGNTSFSRWLYDIHNMVNDKLREQGLLKTPNPSWSTVHDLYDSMQAALCETTPMVGWDFFASIAYTTPTKGIASKPMPIPAGLTPTMEDRNRYNLLTPAERRAKLKAWWKLTPSILPCQAWRSAWNHCVEEAPLTKGRGPVSCWLWSIEESVCSSLKCPTPHASLPNLKYEMAAFESACTMKKSTCRTRRQAQRRTVLTRRKRAHASLVL